MNKYNLPENHYSMEIEPIEFIQANKLSFAVGNIIKYVCRYEHKDGLKDLQKAKDYIDILMQEYGEKLGKEEKHECKCKCQEPKKYYNPATKQYDLTEPVTVPQYGD